MIIRNAELEGHAAVDLRVDGGRITEAGAALARGPGEEVLDALGGALLPGLHDHHVHLWALAARAASVELGPGAVSSDAAFAAVLRAVPGDGWLRGVDYHESVAGALDRDVLDAIVGARPVRVQHRTGALWVLSSEAIALTGVEHADVAGIERDSAGRATGRLWRLDEWLRDRVPPIQTELREVSARAAAAGITGYTDANPHRVDADVARLRDAQDRGELLQRVHVMGPAELEFVPAALLSLGPVKVLLDDDRLPSPEQLTGLIEHAHSRRRAVAVHCVTVVQLVLALHALAEAGAAPGDRIEHASVVPPALIDEIVRLGLTVVTQPGFVVARGDRYLADVDRDELASLYRCRSLIAAGVATAAGTDAPFGPADPWVCIKAAVDRRTAEGAGLGPDERLAPLDALRLFLGWAADPGTPRAISPGAPADLCLLDAPLSVALQDPSSERVAVTIVDGRIVHRSSE